MQVLVQLLGFIVLTCSAVLAADWKFTYPRPGTQLSRSRQFGVFWTGDAPRLSAGFDKPGETATQHLNAMGSYRLSFVRIGGPNPADPTSETYLAGVFINEQSRHFPGNKLPKKGSYQIWARKFTEENVRGDIPASQKSATFQIVD